MPASFSAPLRPDPAPAPSTPTTPASGTGGGADPSGPPDPSPVADPDAPTYGESGQTNGDGPVGSGSGQSGGAGGGAAAGSSETGGGEDGSSGDAGGMESAWWVGQGEPGQINEFAGELHNVWMRVDRIRDSYTPPFYGPNYGRFDLRYNGYDAVLYATVYDNGGNHRADTLLDFANGTLTTWHADQLHASDNKGWWYLGTASDQRFISVDGRDASLWVYNAIDDYSFLVGLGRMTITNNDYTRYGAVDCGDGSFYLFNEVHTYLMKEGVISASNADYTRYASLNGADGTLYIFNEERSYLMKEGRVVASNADGTRYASLDSNDGSLWIYNELHQYVINGGRITAADSDYAHFAALDGGKGELYLYDPTFTYVMKEGRMAISNADGTSYVAADAHDGSFWAYDAGGNNFLYRAESLKVYSDTTGQTATLSTGDGTYLSLSEGTATGRMKVEPAALEFFLDFNSMQGFAYNGATDTLSVYNGSTVSTLTPTTLTVNDSSDTGSFWPSGLVVRSGSASGTLDTSVLYLNDGGSTGTYESGSVTLNASGSGVVSMSAGDLPAGYTAYFQPATVCIDGATKFGYILFATTS